MTRLQIARAAERALREAFLEAGRRYADATDGGLGTAPNGAALAAQANLRLAAKPWRRAERDLLAAKAEEPEIR